MRDDWKQRAANVAREISLRDPSHGVVVGVDGVDGAGKTTLVAALAETYGSRLSTVATKPFGSPHDVAVQQLGHSLSVGQVLYDLALDEAYSFDDVEMQLALTVCVRRHERRVVQRLRLQHELVLTDRSALSAAAYSAATDARIRAIVDWAVRPIAIEDVIFWLDVDADVAFARRTPKQFVTHAGSDKILAKGPEYQQRASQEFERLAFEHDNVIRINASKSADAVRRQVVSILDPMVARC